MSARSACRRGRPIWGTASASNLGGAIETFTSDPAHDLGLRFGQTLGSYDAQRSYLRIDSGEVEGLGGTNGGYLSIVRQKARTWEFNAKRGGYQANAKFVHKDAHATLTGYFDYSNKQEPNQDSVAHNAGGLEPYYRSLLYPDFAKALAYLDADGNVPANVPANYLNYYGDAQRKDYLGYLKLDYRFSDAVTFSNQVYYHHDDGEGQIAGPITVAGLPGLFRIYYPGQNLKQVFGNSGYALRTTEYTIDRQGLLSRLAVHAGDHEIELGGWYEHNTNTVRRRWYAFPIDNPSTPYVRADPALRRLTQYGSDIAVDIVQAHLQDRWHITPALTLEAGFKSSLQFAEGVVPVQPLPGALSGASTGLPEGKISTKKWFLPAIGGTWDVTPSEQIFANAQKNVRQFQTSVAAGQSPYNLGSQQAFDQFKIQTSPESSWTYEAGVRSYRSLSFGPITAIEGQVNYYHVDFSNRLLQISATPGIASVIGGVSILQNVGGVTTNGVDFAATLHFGPHFSLYDAVSYNSSKYDDNYVSGTATVPTAGKYVPNTARWLNKVVASAQGGGFEVQLIGDYVGRRYATYTNDRSISGRFLLNAQAGYQLPAFAGIGLKNAKLSVNVTNLTKRRGIYEIVVGAASRTYNSYATPPRQLFFTLSNFPAVPQWSAVEFFDPRTLVHRRTVSLGGGIGSLTWVDRHDGAWWAMFANYDGKGGEPGRDHRYTTLVRFDDAWRRTESWFLPATVLERIAPMSISGGGWGPDGRLYLTGHDRPELYAMTLPKGGGVLDHVDTIAIEAAGQAVDWDQAAPGMLYGIDRQGGRILGMKVPWHNGRTPGTNLVTIP